MNTQAKQAQSYERWLKNQRVKAQKVMPGLLKVTLAGWDHQERIVVAFG